MIEVGDTVRRITRHARYPVEYPEGYTFVVGRAEEGSVYESNKKIPHARVALETIDPVLKVNSRMDYSFKTQHHAKFNLTEVDISREVPYALVKMDSYVPDTVYYHSSLVVKADILGLEIPDGFSRTTNGNYYVLVSGKLIGKTLALLDTIVKAPWDKADECTVSVKLYSGE